MRLFILTLLLSFNADAGWISKEGLTKLKSDGKGYIVYSKQSKCIKKHTQCYNYTNIDLRASEVKMVTEDDLTKPIYKPMYSVESCSSEENCMTEAYPKLQCLEGDQKKYQKNSIMPGFSAFCTGITGYQQVTHEKLVENSDLKANLKSQDESLKKQQDAMDKVLKDQGFGRRLVAMVVLGSKNKKLTRAQRKQLQLDFNAIQGLLMAGSLDAAKAEIEAITPDGVMVTQEQKDEIIRLFDDYQIFDAKSEAEMWLSEHDDQDTLEDVL